MHVNNIIRSVCYFSNTPGRETVAKVNAVASQLQEQGYEIQTKRICTPYRNPKELEDTVNDRSIRLCVGNIPFRQAFVTLPSFYTTNGVSFHTDLTYETIGEEHTQILFHIIKDKPSHSFNFTYVFNNHPSSPYFPSAAYERNGFSIGLQPTDLSEGCSTLEEWLGKIKASWKKIDLLFGNNPAFLGIDSSIASIFSGKGSLINFIKRLDLTFEHSVTTDIYLRITEFLKKQNPKPVGLCGLMMPCLEDFELADEYEKGNFTIERNVFLSLHCGLGIDTYPVGVNENPERVVEILKLIQGLSNKYQKPLSVRLMSDGKAKIGEKTNFQNQYLKDVTIRKL